MEQAVRSFLGVAMVRRGSYILKLAAQGMLKEDEASRVIRSFDIVGDIAVVKVPRELEGRRFIIGEGLLKSFKHLKVVLRQTSPTWGVHRVRGLEWLAGEDRSETIHKEFGCLFAVDLAKVFFSPRLSYERMRIAKLVNKHETIVNMFSGVGCFSIIIAKHASPSKIYSIDINPEAFNYMVRNVKLNKVEGVVVPILGDSKQVMINGLRKIADRVLMPLPELALKYLHVALEFLKPSGGWVHAYDFIHAKRGEDPVEKAEEVYERKLKELGVKFNILNGRIVRDTGPRWHQVGLDIRINHFRLSENVKYRGVHNSISFIF